MRIIRGGAWGLLWVTGGTMLVMAVGAVGVVSLLAVLTALA